MSAAVIVTTTPSIEGKKITSYRDIALEEIKTAAAEIGANAVVAIDIDYETVGGNASMLMVTVSGTAVVLQ